MQRCFATALLLLALTGCSTLDSINPFASSGPKMAELLPINATLQARVVWRESVGKSDVYAFAPAVVGSSVYAASKDGTLLDMAVDRDIIHKSGAWFSYEDQRIGQGRENARQYLKDNPDIAVKIDKIIRDEAKAELASRKAGTPTETVEEELAEADKQIAEEDPDLALMDEDV